MLEKSLIQRLIQSTQCNLHIDPVPDTAPNGLKSDCLATIIDHHRVFDECEADSKKLDRMKSWVAVLVMKKLPEKIAADSKFAARLQKKFATKDNPTGGFIPTRSGSPFSAIDSYSRAAVIRSGNSGTRSGKFNLSARGESKHAKQRS
ncbi:MAG: hypothetical protein AAB467_00165 [Patescibacteria group bacterium]